jgi:branched-chain amino acid transport system substrate-binding protein
MAKYFPEADKADAAPLAGYNQAIGLVQVLKQCGDDLTRENVMKQAANLDFEISTQLPGIRIKTSPTDFFPMEQLQMMRFTGERWEFFGPVLDSHVD